jgi:hypothetical protein
MAQILEDITVTGTVKVVVRDENGDVKEEREIKNLVVTSGRNFIAGRMTGTATAMSHMAVGSGTATPALGDTALGTQLGRVALTSATTTNNVTTYTATFAAGTGTGAVTEAGIFNASTGGTMLCRTTFAVVNKGAQDTLAITWAVTIS